MTRRKRYCDIKAHSLEDILFTCNRHIKNINMTHVDLLSEGDGDDTDYFYIDMFRGAWEDMRDDVERMMKGRQ